ncbi:MAG: class I mannose-6-phosphate isomerase [Planctomycetes bacterium]|nr:class I mannose-6-phosphate isomerase [Planctomycetota bacterium]
MSAPRPLEPLRFQRQFLEKPWGGRSLERVLGLALPPGKIGETWELVDRDRENSVVAEGAFQGRTLRELLREHGDALLGRARRSPAGEFPVLVKFLDAREDLSVQVHPHDDHAAELARGDAPKTECWYVLDATPESVLYHGLKPGVDAATFAARASGPGVLELLERHTVRAGDFVFVPGGTVHAIGAGIALAEVQQTSDTTYRLYDWGRVDDRGRPRAMHVDAGLRVIRFGVTAPRPVHPTTVERGRGVRAVELVDAPAFAVELVELDAGAEFALDALGRARIHVVLAGRGALRWREAADARASASARATPAVIGAMRSCELAPGDTWLVPASLGEHVIEAREPLRLLVVRTQE